MGGAAILCGDLEGEDKSGSPIGSVLHEAYSRAFGRPPRGKISAAFARLLGRGARDQEGQVEKAILDVKYNEEGELPPEVAEFLLPHLREYQQILLRDLKIENDVEQICNCMSRDVDAKYGATTDPGWHLYCLHDLVKACEKSAKERIPVQFAW